MSAVKDLEDLLGIEKMHWRSSTYDFIEPRGRCGTITEDKHCVQLLNEQSVHEITCIQCLNIAYGNQIIEETRNVIKNRLMKLIRTYR